MCSRSSAISWRIGLVSRLVVPFGATSSRGESATRYLPYGGASVRAGSVASRHRDTTATIVRVMSTVGVCFAAIVAVSALLAGCTADSDRDNIEVLIDERIEAALAQRAVPTTTEAAVDIEALIDERVGHQAARTGRMYEDLLQYVECGHALDDFALNIKHLLVLDELRSTAPFVYHDGSDDRSFGDIPYLMDHLFTHDGKMLGEANAERLCFDDGYGLPLSRLRYDGLVTRLDEFLQTGQPLLGHTPWEYRCEHGPSSYESRWARSQVDAWCETVLARYRD